MSLNAGFALSKYSVELPEISFSNVGHLTFITVMSFVLHNVVNNCCPLRKYFGCHLGISVSGH